MNEAARNAVGWEVRLARRLSGKVAVVTGAGQGIGEAIARQFASEGARVCVAELNPATGEAVANSLVEQGHEAMGVVTDVADPESVERAIAETARRLGPPTVLVNNAGIAVFDDPLTLTAEDWRRCFAVDLDGVWHCMRAVLPHMIEAGQGSIVNIASVHSFQIIPHTFPYPVAKHGVLGLTRALGVEYGPKNIRVNAICPGYIETQIAFDYWAGFPDPEAERRRAGGFHAMKRCGKPDEVAAAALFLASDEASFITATHLMVDGGGSVVFHD
jgi:NAD(P)-dependent dehydrogenase (short-subunit alcohol dehydrogenase family)